MQPIPILTVSAMLLVTRGVNAEASFDTSNLANGEYTYMYNDGHYTKEETGKLDSEGSPVVTGEFRYVLGDNEYIVTYTADKDGFHPIVTITDFNLNKFGPSLASAVNPSLAASLLGK